MSTDTDINELSERIATAVTEQVGEFLDRRPAGGGDGISPFRIYDTSGRVHGELTGSNDASVVNDAIDDRAEETSIVIPSPGFDLHWDEQVDIPLEDRFGLHFIGTPQLETTGSFSGDYAFFKPQEQTRELHLGPCNIKDDAGVLEEGVHLEDIRGATLDRVKVYNAPGIRIVSETSYSNQNVLNQCEIRFPRASDSNRNGGPGIVLDEGSDDITTDQNWIFAPMFNATPEHNNEIGYIDRGKHNNWLYTRFEFGHTIHQMEGGLNYYISEGGWDRPSEYTVRETRGTSRNPPSGHIESVFGDNFERLRILHPNTRVTSMGDVDSGARGRNNPIDLLESVKELTRNRSLESCGFGDESNGGSVEVGGLWYYKPFVEWSTGSGSGNTAKLTTGENSLKAQSHPKAAYCWGPRSSSDASGVIARTGLYASDGDRFELVSDSSKRSGNWHLEVAQKGDLKGSKDLGVAPHETNDLALNVANLDSGTRFCGTVDYSEDEIEASLNGFGAGMEWHWTVESRDGSGKDWMLRDDRGMRMYKF